MISLDSMKKMDEVLNSFLEKNEFAMSVLEKIPVDIFQLATLLGFAVFPARLGDSIDGLLYVDSENRIQSYDKIIMFNEKLKNDEAHARFVVAHELGHFIEKSETGSNANKLHDSLAARTVHNSQNTRSDYERQIDYLAASLLMPRDSVMKYIEKNTKKVSDFDFDFYYGMARHYIVEIDAAKERVNEVRTAFAQ